LQCILVRYEHVLYTGQHIQQFLALWMSLFQLSFHTMCLKDLVAIIRSYHVISYHISYVSNHITLYHVSYVYVYGCVVLAFTGCNSIYYNLNNFHIFVVWLLLCIISFYDCSVCDWVLFYELFLCMSWFNSDLFYILGLAKKDLLN
jgi:hypothetical protein